MNNPQRRKDDCGLYWSDKKDIGGWITKTILFLITGALAINAYFLKDIHQEFKSLKQAVSVIKLDVATSIETVKFALLRISENKEDIKDLRKKHGQ